jgi:hypothetical protein
MPSQSGPRYFVVVYGDPAPNGDTVESGTYTAGDRYPPFDVAPGDKLLLYCAEGYRKYSLQVRGIGVVHGGDRDTIKYDWKPLLQPITRQAMLQAFEDDDRKKMSELRFNTRRVFEVDEQSFLNAVRDSMPAEPSI